MEPSTRIRTILKSLSYTPTTLAKDAEISISKAKRILEGDKALRFNDLELIIKATGINPNLLLGSNEGGAAV